MGIDMDIAKTFQRILKKQGINFMLNHAVNGRSLPPRLRTRVIVGLVVEPELSLAPQHPSVPPWKEEYACTRIVASSAHMLNWSVLLWFLQHFFQAR
jgi:hypothetical protein